MNYPLPKEFNPNYLESTDAFGETDPEYLKIINEELTEKSLRNYQTVKFIFTYMGCRHPREAAIAAGFSEKSAYATGRRLLKKPDVFKAIKRISEKSAAKCGLDADALFERVKEIIDFDPIDIVDKNGATKQLKDMDPHVRRCLVAPKVKEIHGQDENGVKVKTGEIVEWRPYDKLKCIEMAARELSIFIPSVNVNVNHAEDMKKNLLGSLKRAEEATDVTPEEIEPEYKRIEEPPEDKEENPWG